MINEILIFVSFLVIISYFFDVLSKFIKIPSVLFLLACGILIRIFWSALGMPDYSIKPIIEILGTVGLVLIVLEGSLDLSVAPERRKEGKSCEWHIFFALCSRPLIPISPFRHQKPGTC